MKRRHTLSGGGQDSMTNLHDHNSDSQALMHEQLDVEELKVQGEAAYM